MLHLQPYIRQLKNALLQNFATHHHQTSPSVQKPPDPTKYLGKPWKAKGNRKNPYRILKQSWPSLWLVPHPFFFFLPVAPWEKSSLDRITSPFWSLQKRNRTIKSEVWSAERSGPQWQYERPVFRATSFCFCPTGFHAHSRLPSRTCIPVHLRASCRRISKTHTGESTESIESVSTPSKAINSRLCECISRWIIVHHVASQCIDMPVAKSPLRAIAYRDVRVQEMHYACTRPRCIVGTHSRTHRGGRSASADCIRGERGCIGGEASQSGYRATNSPLQAPLTELRGGQFALRISSSPSRPFFFYLLHRSSSSSSDSFFIWIRPCSRLPLAAIRCFRTRLLAPFVSNLRFRSIYFLRIPLETYLSIFV